MNIAKKLLEQVIYNQNDSYRIRTLLVVELYGIVSLIMFVMNIFKGEKIVITMTALLTFVCAIFVVVIIKYKRFKVIRVLFAMITIIAVNVFLFFGSSGGVAAYWAFMIPIMGQFLFGLGIGTIASALVLLSSILMLWWPSGPLVQYPYNQAFIMRFPILYATFMMSAMLMEYVQKLTLVKLEGTVHELNQITHIDALTNIENRRSIEKKIYELWGLFKGHENHISVLMIDIDYFKQYNDYYGHLQGDDALRKVARIIEQIVSRSNGYVARWGGEEFLCLLPFLDCISSTEVASEIVRMMSKSQLEHLGSELADKVLTVSVGVSSVNITDGVDPLFVIAGADASLYEAKHAGRNQVGTCQRFGLPVS